MCRVDSNQKHLNLVFSCCPLAVYSQSGAVHRSQIWCPGVYWCMPVKMGEDISTYDKLKLVLSSEQAVMNTVACRLNSLNS
jgi:hypothetical protein